MKNSKYLNIKMPKLSITPFAISGTFQSYLTIAPEHFFKLKNPYYLKG